MLNLAMRPRWPLDRAGRTVSGCRWRLETWVQVFGSRRFMLAPRHSPASTMKTGSVRRCAIADSGAWALSDHDPCEWAITRGQKTHRYGPRASSSPRTPRPASRATARYTTQGVAGEDHGTPAGLQRAMIGPFALLAIAPPRRARGVPVGRLYRLMAHRMCRYSDSRAHRIVRDLTDRPLLLMRSSPRSNSCPLSARRRTQRACLQPCQDFVLTWQRGARALAVGE